ncbi:ImpA_N domain-containing protein [Rubrivivax sp. A210]|uniref:type VI secretion system protein TssA n=1 Tax=Rubrivivax sp. A210 TaxID=2772301 RepID=UPI0019184FD4|nr:type VI secretion system protein TssA [Rubrivivax sp. A210]CAD5369330.1 ImpA_N domain-containing protein [Rubrivivax sp. A210]
MSDLEEAEALVNAWLQPLGDEAAPCGPDLEYEPEFLELTQAAAGRPETQFGPGEPPDWRGVVQRSEAMLGRSRDLRIAIFWLRGSLHLQGYRALLPGLKLIGGMLEGLWDVVHPLPDPDDGDPYARVNALSLLASGEGLLTDLRQCAVVRDRAVGQISGRDVELATGLAQPVGEEAVSGREQLARMMAAVVERDGGARDDALATVAALRTLQSTISDRFSSADAPDLKPLLQLANAVAALMPREVAEASPDADAESADSEDAPAAVHAPPAAGGRGLSGGIQTRDDALRAIDMVCEFLERTEPSNPAPLFLRRARQLVNHNFLQLMKELAPTMLPDVARIVGVDPDTVESPQAP